MVEVVYHLYCTIVTDKHIDYDSNHRIMFFGNSDGGIFNNINDIFTYLPKKNIRSVSIYFNDRDFHIEYDYQFHTNNVGLVQDADIYQNVDSMLFLGDSFTEGQGAAPWFPSVARDIAKLGYQPINGGLLGTGFAQWSKLDNYLTSKSFRIKKLVVLFISDDYGRLIFHFSDQVLRCLSFASSCAGNEGFYPLPPVEDISSWVDLIKDVSQRTVFNDRIKKLLPASYHVYELLRRRLHTKYSDAAIAELIEKYGPTNVTFIHLPQKDELDGPRGLGLSARRSIAKAGGRLYDGFKLCGLTASDYHVNDGHPNENGYAKIALCTSRIIKQEEAVQP